MKFYTTVLIIVLTASTSFAATSFKVERWNTSNGAKVVFYQAMEVPMLDINVAFAAGSAYDEQQFGVSALTTDLLNQGNAGLSANEVSERLADTGAQYASETNRDLAVFSLKTLVQPQALQQATTVFNQILSQPNFRESAFLREKNQQLMAIKHVQEQPDERASQAFFDVLYQKHPYAHPIIGTKETVQSLRVEDVRQFYQQHFVASNAVIVLVGAIDSTKAHELAERVLKNIPAGTPSQQVPKASSLTEALDVKIPFPASQTVIRMGQLGINHHDKNFFPLLVGNYTLGGGMLVSQLALEIREKRGLTYGITSQFVPLSGRGPFIIGFSTKSSQAGEALSLVRKTLANFMKVGPNDEELTAAKHYLTGSFPLSLASNQSIANMLLKIAFYHLPDDYLDTYIDKINSVTAQEIKQAFQQSIHPEKLLQVTVGKM